jgi:hypothetical protein
MPGSFRPNRVGNPGFGRQNGGLCPGSGRDSVRPSAKSGLFAGADAASHMKLRCVAQKCHDMGVGCHNPKG